MRNKILLVLNSLLLAFFLYSSIGYFTLMYINGVIVSEKKYYFMGNIFLGSVCVIFLVLSTAYEIYIIRKFITNIKNKRI